ncbi:MAG: metallophosphoesterase family protein [Anderseniella sp.]
MDRLAVIADTHGNSWALKAVLDDIRQRGIADIVNLGDSADADMDPGGALALLIDGNVPSIAGNYETFTDGQLTTDQITWLQGLPKTLDLGPVFCCHGTPASDTQELIEKITPGRVEIADVEEIRQRLDGVKHDVVLCAHKHVPRLVRLPTGQLIMNPGSVGLPAYWNDEPVLHKVEAGSPHARYAILRKAAGGWDVDHIALTYRWDLAAAAARKSGRDDRASFIETGRAQIPDGLTAT